MSDKSDNSDVFARALDNREDVSATFYANFGWDSNEAAAMLDLDRKIRPLIRGMMNRHGGIVQMRTMAEPQLGFAESLLRDGRVGAVDGTNALSKIDYMNTTKYACATGWLTNKQRGKPAISITRTSSVYIDRDKLDVTTTTLAELSDYLDRVRDNQSWPTTFREYMERDIALRECDADYIFLDGPIFTQNLMSQLKGRALYDEMLASKKHWIGVIKNISGSTSDTKWAAASLEPGEVWTVRPVYEQVIRRANAQMRNLVDWAKNDALKPYIRVVFRPAQKAFAFECHAADLELACALLLVDASKTLNHELPLLLETIDSQLRAGFNCSEASEINLNRMIHESKDGDHMQDYRDQLDVTDEREWR